ncbi:MAG: galactosyldiacylglycerol synthase [Oscillospiraceae bacterium]|jgi:processive 1,2-diacylglycerol beta-glucosyltransferase|nr:galactosyldiacylglycerol synthase [Oscillospiraceae bacterium]
MRILILTAATGGGHKRTGAALKEAIQANNPTAYVNVMDALEACGERFNKTVTGGYHYMATKVPKIYGQAYKMADNETPLNSFMDKINSQMSIKLLPAIVAQMPDVIVSCHPFVTKMLGTLKGKGYIIQPVISIITDFAGHRAYIDEHIDKYVVANDDMIAEMVVKYKVPQQKVFSLGIPIFPEFYEKPDKNKVLAQLGFSPELPTLLIMAGSFGVTDILAIYENLCECETEFQIIVITGKNQKLYNAFEKLLNREIKEFDIAPEDEAESKKQSNKVAEQIKGTFKDTTDKIKESFKDGISELPFVHYTRTTNKSKPTKLLYFINNVQDYMHCADLIVTKPGGLTVSESLAAALPMAIFRAIPGQESDNADYLVRHGMAVILSKGHSGARMIESLLSSPEQLEQMRRNCQTFFKQQSAKNVYGLIKTTFEEWKRRFV